ncbi:hypothetical protein P9112_009265 [Eukaryota sp. TZLM1-RC]
MVTVNLPSGRRETLETDISLDSFASDSFDSIALLNKHLVSFPILDTSTTSGDASSFDTTPYKQRLESLYADLRLLHNSFSQEISVFESKLQQSSRNLSTSVVSAHDGIKTSEKLLAQLLSHTSISTSTISSGAELGDAYEALAACKSDEEVLSNLLCLMSPDLADEEAIKQANLQLTPNPNPNPPFSPMSVLSIADAFSSLSALLSPTSEGMDTCSFSLSQIPIDNLSLLNKRISIAQDQLHATCQGHLCQLITSCVTPPRDTFIQPPRKTVDRGSKKELGDMFSSEELALITAFTNTLLQLESISPLNYNSGDYICSEYSLSSLRPVDIKKQAVLNAVQAQTIDPTLIRYFAACERLVEALTPVLLLFSNYGLDELVTVDLPLKKKGLGPVVSHVVSLISKRSAPTALTVIDHVYEVCEVESIEQEGLKKEVAKDKHRFRSKHGRSVSVSEGQTTGNQSKNDGFPKISTECFLERLVDICQFSKRQCLRISNIISKYIPLTPQDMEVVVTHLSNASNSILSPHLKRYVDLELSALGSILKVKLSADLLSKRLVSFKDSSNYHYDFVNELQSSFPIHTFQSIWSSLVKATERSFQLFSKESAQKYAIMFLSHTIKHISFFNSKILSLFIEKPVTLDSSNHVCTIPSLLGYLITISSACFSSISDFKSRWFNGAKEEVLRDILLLVRQISAIELQVSDLITTFLNGIENCAAGATSLLINQMQSGKSVNTVTITQGFSDSLSRIVNSINENFSDSLWTDVSSKGAQRLFKGVARGIPSSFTNSSMRIMLVHEPLLFLPNLLEPLKDSKQVGFIQEGVKFIKNLIISPDNLSGIKDLSEGALKELTEDLVSEFLKKAGVDESHIRSVGRGLLQRRPID